MRDEKKVREIKMLLSGLAEYYRADLTENQYAMYSDDLADLDIFEIGEAIKRIRRSAVHKFFPLPGVIREEIHGSARDEALEAANRIVQAMARFGWVNPGPAREFIGELGWRIVEREGGWQAICERTTNDDLPTLKAQWRELAAATQRRADRGKDSAPNLIQLPGGLFKSIPDASKK